MKNNEKLRKAMKENDVFMWQVAHVIGVSEQTIIRWFRLPLSEEHYRKVSQAIEQLKAGVANE